MFPLTIKTSFFASSCFTKHRANRVSVTLPALKGKSLVTRGNNFKQQRFNFLHSPSRGGVQTRAGEGPIKEKEVKEKEAKEEEEEEPVWIRRERELKAQEGQDEDLPYGLYLLLSGVILIAVVGSCFELAYQNPVFGVIQPDSAFYLPILLFFIITGLPTATFLWMKAVKSANDATDMQDRLDGYK
mmetsp:Transcript_19535/g.27036  ORF Transcript_19535/g.27036 Transcript_19535/m.27036 type:complete len:186 (+) Transcript_19535:98-655(+)|eukprot:CAMPEP_0196586120 /NCGR_PEP_ID=MMETSP1081-20130531/53230_1 /TAXON_ID=36882 /ORGANISM="Pyramimonas amylifera, Strain CCMP720" /LENGTH=185 /DNA_ID=CAMNT_0041907895 /DNA_START=97 /DNA_END=654 /DNA_ORIENTATION=+